MPHSSKNQPQGIMNTHPLDFDDGTIMTKRFYDGLDDEIKNTLLGQIRNLWTHASTAIEGNILTLGDTAFVLDEGLTVSGKPLKDHNEVYGHAKAIELVYGFVARDRLAETEIFALHKAIITERVMDIYKPVGGWKKTSNYTSFIARDGKQMMREYPAPHRTARLMQQWLEEFNASFGKNLSSDDAVRVYADLHLKFVTIHPFYDGNGRMARLLSNLPVLKAGFPPIVVPSEDRQRYKETISRYQETVPGLALMSDIRSLCDNAENTRFRYLCADYWSETLELVENARDLQSRSGSAPTP